MKRIHRFLAPIATLILLFGGADVALAQFGIDIPSPGSVMEDIEDRYHISREAIQDFGEGFNVSNNKGISPEVSIFFSPSDPREGEKITAKGFPMFFSNPNDQMYYTWYLKRADCDLGSVKEAYCDADRDGTVTVNDWKVAAMRILVTDNSDPDGFDYGSDTDDDGYRAEYGGSLEAYTSSDWCYVHDPGDGGYYELDSCFHLFAEPSSGTNGDGSFGVSEERFWGSNPKDPDTADNGNKDEANAVGLGRDTFVWNYQAGDRVGLVVEGTAMTPTKHEDSSYMIMWAFSKNKCDVTGKGSYSQNIRGYDITFPTSSMDADDLDDCLEANLVDPFEGGQGKSQKLEVSVTAAPDRPVNDKEEGIGGDMLFALATVDNSSRSPSELFYDWTIGISDNPVDGFTDITDAIVGAELLPTAEGNGLDQIAVSLNMDDGVLGSYAGTDPFYLRLTAEVQENYSSGVIREGKSDVIVRVANTDKRIGAYSTTASVSGDTATVSRDAEICDLYYPNPSSVSEASENLNRIACRVIRNEIIGVYVDPSGLADFSWSINGASLRCSSSVSTDSDCTNGNAAFFAVSGKPGETYNVRFDATNVDTGKSVSLSRKFQVVEPEVVIESTDTGSAWPMFQGTFRELDGTTYEDYSESAFQSYPDMTVSFEAKTIPSYVANLVTAFEWGAEGSIIDAGTEEDAAETYPVSYTPVIATEIEDTFQMSFSAMVAQSDEKRQALRDIFGIDAVDSSEFGISKGIRINLVETDGYASASAGTDGPKRFFAAVSRYVPPFALFAFRMFATAALILFTVGFVFSLMPETPSAKPARGRRDA